MNDQPASDEKKRPRYQEIAETLRNELITKSYQVGDPFPKELELCERFGVSRYTIRSALSELEAAGLLKRQKAIGTIVKALTPESSYVQSLSSMAELLQYPSDTRLDVRYRQEIAADGEMADMLEVSERAPLVNIGGVRTRTADGVAICWADVFVVPPYGDVSAFIGKDDRPVYRIIEEEFDEHISSVDVQMSAIALLNPEAQFLGVAHGTPALKIVRRYRGNDDRIFETSITLHPQDRFTYSMNFTYETKGS